MILNLLSFGSGLLKLVLSSVLICTRQSLPKEKETEFIFGEILKHEISVRPSKVSFKSDIEVPA